MTPLVSIQNPGSENVQEVRERGLDSFSFLKKTESQAWGRNGKKKRKKVLKTFFFKPFLPHAWDSVFLRTLKLQSALFNWSPPKLSMYKIPLYPQALKEFTEQLTWDLVLRKFRGGPVKRSAL